MGHQISKAGRTKQVQEMRRIALAMEERGMAEWSRRRQKISGIFKKMCNPKK